MIRTIKMGPIEVFNDKLQGSYFLSNNLKSMMNRHMKFDPLVIFLLLKRMNSLDHDFRAYRNRKIEEKNQTGPKGCFQPVIYIIYIQRSNGFHKFLEITMNKGMRFGHIVIYQDLQKRMNGLNCESRRSPEWQILGFRIFTNIQKLL